MSKRVVITEIVSEQRVMLDQQLALGAYLQALLRPPAIDTPAPALALPLDASPSKPEPLGETVSPGTEPVNESPTPPETGAGERRPDWAQAQFQCLLFQVAGLTLALPLARLSGVLPWDTAAVTEMPNHQPWFLGLRTHLGHKVKLIDVAKLILPVERRAALAPATSGRLGKVILLDDSRWGLACDNVAEVITLSAADVKWRAQAGSRPWLAGTVIKQMCALIDTRAFAEMLDGSPQA
jgi:purine-binding chemotaxis protein CheW